MSWRDLTLSSYREKKNDGGLPHDEGERLWTRQPVPPRRVSTILHGLETFVPNTRTVRDHEKRIWWACCFKYYTRLYRDVARCVVHDNFAFMGTGLTPVSFFPASRTLVFIANGSWVYSTQIARGAPPNTEHGVPPPRSRGVLAAARRLQPDAPGLRHAALLRAGRVPQAHGVPVGGR